MAARKSYICEAIGYITSLDSFDSSNLQSIFESSENVSRYLRILKVVFEYFSRNPKAVDRRGDPRVDSRL